MNKLDKAKQICQLLKNTAEEVLDEINADQKHIDDFAIGFAKFVHQHYYTHNGEEYYYKNIGIQRNIKEVLDNYKMILNEQKAKASVHG